MQLPGTNTQAKSLLVTPNNERSPCSAHFQLGKLGVMRREPLTATGVATGDKRAGQ